MIEEVDFIFIEPHFIAMQEGFDDPCMHVLCKMPFHDVANLVGDAIL